MGNLSSTPAPTNPPPNVPTFKPPQLRVRLTPRNNTQNMSQQERWGFVVYRAAWGGRPDADARWATTKEKVIEGAIEAAREDIEENDGDADTATLVFVEDEGLLKGKGVGEIRRIFNPNYTGHPDTDEPPLPRADGMCDNVCLVIDDASLESILEGDTPYVVAVDATTETSEQMTVVGDEMRPVPWDGTMKVEVGDVFPHLYLRAVGEGAISMAEVHPDVGEIWEGI